MRDLEKAIASCGQSAMSPLRHRGSDCRFGCSQTWNDSHAAVFCDRSTRLVFVKREGAADPGQEWVWRNSSTRAVRSAVATGS